MKTIQEIQQQLAELTNEVNQLANQETKPFTFTHDEMKKFVKQLHEEFFYQLEKTVDNMRYEEELVTVTLERKRIETEIDTEEISRQIIQQLEMDESEIESTVEMLYSKIVS